MASYPVRNPLARVAPLGVATAYALIVIAGWGRGHAADLMSLCLGYVSAIVAATILAACAIFVYTVWEKTRRGEPFSVASLVGDFLHDRWRVDRGLSVWQPLLTFVILMTAFTFFKQTALHDVGFGSGPWIADVDRALFGTDPWHITHMVLASPWWSQALDLAYHAWFAPMTLGVAACAFAKPDSILSWRYLLAYCLLWVVLGSVIAFTFPAGGPAFFAHFQHQAERFSELSQLLDRQDATLRAQGAPGLSALVYQRHLLFNFQHGIIVIGGGISAMPSLHNALSVLFACAAGHLSRRLGRLTIAYAVIVWIGSIHLGWHFALDGIVSVAATISIWRFTAVMSQFLNIGCHNGQTIGAPVAGAFRPTLRWGDR